MAKLSSVDPLPRVRRRPGRRPNRPQPVTTSDYTRNRATVALGIFIVFFGLLWLINGDMTATFTHERFSLPITYGWAGHVFISLLELAGVFLAPYLVGLPRSIGATLLVLSLPMAVYDVLSTAVGLEQYMHWTGMQGTGMHLQNTIAAMLVAFLPERMLYWLFVALGNVLKSR